MKFFNTITPRIVAITGYKAKMGITCSMGDIRKDWYIKIIPITPPLTDEAKSNK
jgi:hypothetical protein